MAHKLENKTALIIGGSRGIGRAISERLAREGAAVIINYAHNQQAAEAVVKTIVRSGGKAQAIQADISQPTHIKRLFDEAEQVFGKLHIVFANTATEILFPGNSAFTLTAFHYTRQTRL